MGIEFVWGEIEVQRQVLDSLTTVLQQPGVAQTGHWQTFIVAWLGFADWRLLLRLVVSVAVAVLLTAAIALHPRRHGRASTVEEVTYPTTLFLYTIVGAMVAEVVVMNPSMALVVFGIGGLLRFRTNVGEAVDTGQLILVTIIGIASGLHLFPLAVLGTASGWVLLHVRHRRVLYTVELSDLKTQELYEIDRETRASFGTLHCRIVHGHIRRQKGRIDYVLSAPPVVTEQDIEDKLSDELKERGEVDVRPA